MAAPEQILNARPEGEGRPDLALADRAFARAAGSPPIDGNAVRLLQDAGENYPAWLAAIRAAEYSILFENYIVADDAVGREFADALAAKARAGVDVRIVYDWLGSRGAGTLWTQLTNAGARVLVFNRPRLDSPLGWLSRDHRKTIVIDGGIGYVSGLCVSAKWLGDMARRMEPWRDTGIEIRGPAVAELTRAFETVWHACGGEPPQAYRVDATDVCAPAGDVRLRVVAGAPNATGTYRLDLVIASLARHRLWICDAYFVGTTAYVQALAAAARDGVDVRLLVPGASDIPMLSPLSRVGYRGLLEAGVRVFEWNGTMLHAKTAVADGFWARIGSTNLNIASWMGNYELDVAVENRRFGEDHGRAIRDRSRRRHRNRAHGAQSRRADRATKWPGGATCAIGQRDARRRRRRQRRQRVERGTHKPSHARRHRGRLAGQGEHGRHRIRDRRCAMAAGDRMAARRAGSLDWPGVARQGACAAPSWPTGRRRASRGPAAERRWRRRGVA